jgi:hypothetical protein
MQSSTNIYLMRVVVYVSVLPWYRSSCTWVCDCLCVRAFFTALNCLSEAENSYINRVLTLTNAYIMANAVREA